MRSRERNRRKPRSVVPGNAFSLQVSGQEGSVTPKRLPLDAFQFLDLVQLMMVERDLRDPRLARLKAKFMVWFDRELHQVRFRVRFPQVDPHPPRTSWRSIKRAEIYFV